VIQKRIQSFIDRFNVLNPRQYGFRKNFSTEAALLNLIDKITEATDKKEYVISIMIDIKKAFDSLDHGILLLKFQDCGFRGIVLKLLENYLVNRHQYVCYK
jgi:retron-type reverse transcriptase